MEKWTKLIDYWENKKTVERLSQLEMRGVSYQKASDFKNLPKVAYIADEITNHLITGKFYEETILDRVFSYLESQLQQMPYGFAIDVGANIGNHSLYFENKFQKVLSFEPHPDIFALLEINTRLYPKIQCLNLGASNSSKKVKLFESPGNMGASSLMRHTSTTASVDITLVELDSMIGELETVDLIKIDIEGHEPEALFGAKALITRDKPVILMERSSWAGSYDINDQAIDFLRNLGYVFHWEKPELKRAIFSQLVYLIKRWTIGGPTQVNWITGDFPPETRIGLLVATAQKN
jgi:FkbM family methyltransferase